MRRAGSRLIILFLGCSFGSSTRGAWDALAQTPIGAERAEAERMAEHQPALRDGEIQLRGARIDGDGAHVGAVSIGLTAIGREGVMHEVARPRPTIEGPEVQIARAEGVREWWRSLPSGLEQGVTIERRPDGDGELVLAMGIEDGGRVTLRSETAARIADLGGRDTLEYGGLAVVDADGARLSARLAVVDGGVAIHVRDEEARYPIVIDPVVFSLEATIAAAAADGIFGVDVAIAADAGRAAVVGSLGDGGSVDVMARVYVRTGTTWAQEAAILPVTACPVTASSSNKHVAMSRDGNRILVASFGTAPAACVFARSGSAWSFEASLDTSAASTRYGSSLAITDDGSRAMVGDPGGGTFLAGVVRVYVRSGTTWSMESVIANGRTSSAFGENIAASSNGSRLLVMEEWPNFANVLIYDRTGPSWTMGTEFGLPFNFRSTDADLSSDGTRAIVGLNGGTGTVGLALTFAESAGGWAMEGVLSTAGAARGWGGQVVLNPAGTRALVSDSGAATGGIVRLYTRAGSTWTEALPLAPPTSSAGDRFGSAIALSDGPGARAFVTRRTPGSLFVYEERLPVASPCSADDQCGSGFCTDDVCCATACGGTAADCQVCSVVAGGTADGTCSFIGSGTECRASAGPCDPREVCTGSSGACPPDLRSPPATMCRAAGPTCDVTDFCDGSSAACPDVVAAAGTVCNPSSGVVCDLPDTCDGITTTCAARYADSSVVCRPSMGECDVAENCSGDSMGCPADGFATAGRSCGPALAGVCDAPDVCTGTSADCMPTFVSGSVCRPSVGGCDAPESCTGGEAECPPDDVAAAGIVCRASSGACDPTESCDGLVSACPADVTTCADMGVVLDAGANGDASHADAIVTADGGPPTSATGGCGCRTSYGDSKLAWWVVLIGTFVARRRFSRRR